MSTIIRYEPVQSAVFGAASGLAAMSATYLLPDGWPTGVVLVGLAALLFGLYFWMVATTHYNMPELVWIHRNRHRILTAGVVLFLLLTGVAVREAYAAASAKRRLITILGTAEDLKRELLSTKVVPTNRINEWFDSATTVFTQRDWTVCHVEFTHVDEGFTYGFGAPKNVEAAWNTVNRRIAPLRTCINNPR